MERTEVFLTEADRYVFGKGTHYEIYEKLGAHEAERDGIRGIYFAVWAPAAQCVQGLAILITGTVPVMR